MQTLAAGVGDLKKVLTNVKSRGTWGEVQLRLAARAGPRARAVRRERRHARGQQRAGRVRDQAARAATRSRRRCCCRSMRSSRSRTTSGWWTRSEAGDLAASEVAGQALEVAAAAGGARHPRQVHQPAAHHRLRHPVPADRGAARRGAAAHGARRAPAARVPRGRGGPDHAVGVHHEPADGVPHAGHPAAVRRGVGTARPREGRLREVRRRAVRASRRSCRRPATRSTRRRRAPAASSGR